MRLGSMTDPPSPSGRPNMGGSGSPTPSTTREVAGGGDPADAGSGLGRGSDGSMLPPPALEGSDEASGRAGSPPLPGGGALCEFTGYVPTLRSTIAATTTSNSGTDPRGPRKGVSMSFRRSPIEWPSGIGPNPLILNENMAKGGTVNHTRSGRRPELASICKAAKDQRRIGSAKTERIGQDHVDAAPFRVMRHEIDRRLHGRIIEIDGWWHHPVANCQNRKDRLDGTRGTQ